MSTEETTLTVHLKNGSVMKFKHPRASDKSNLVSRTREILDAGHLLVETGDRAIIIPYNSILFMETSPLPEVLPSNCIRGATLID